jgi:hypothetical protein
MFRAICLISAAAILFSPLPAAAGSAWESGHTNAGGKYVRYGLTNPGLKYVYRGSGSTFHTNPGTKYIYPGYSAWGAR